MEEIAILTFNSPIAYDIMSWKTATSQEFLSVGKWQQGQALPPIIYSGNSTTPPSDDPLAGVVNIGIFVLYNPDRVCSHSTGKFNLLLYREALDMQLLRLQSTILMPITLFLVSLWPLFHTHKQMLLKLCWIPGPWFQTESWVLLDLHLLIFVPMLLLCWEFYWYDLIFAQLENNFS